MRTKILISGALLMLLCATTQGQTPVPVLHFNFDNISGTTVINVGSGGSALNGTLNGTASITNGGKFGNCLTVTGVVSTAGSVRIANPVVPLNILPTNAWTVACWIKSTTQGGMWMYQGDGGWANHNTTFGMLVNNGTTGVNGHAAGGVRYAAGWEQGTTVVDDGNWHHIVFVWDGTNKMQYVDGVLDTWVADQWANADGTGGQFYIGGNGNGQGDGQVCLNGLIDEVNVFSNALSQSQVTSLYHTGIPVFVTVNPASGVSGQSFKVTATVTPLAGTVTNVTVDLSALGGPVAASMVLSNANVYTNTFVVTDVTPIGDAALTVTATDTQQLLGNASATYTVFSKNAPAIVNDVTPAGATTLYVGEGILYSAVFLGSPPIYYQWQFSPISDGVNFTNIPGATNNTYTIPSVTLGNAGYYQLQASNQFGTTLAYGGSALVYLIVNTGPPFPTYLWSAPIPFAGLNADQILTNFPGTKVAGALVAKNGGNPILVTNSSADSPIVFAGSGAWANLSGGAGYFTGANTNQTGSTNFNICLNDAYNDNASHTITMNGLIVGQQYQVQLFALDSRGGLSPLAQNRLVNFQDPNNVNDKSQNIAMSDNIYYLATFTATNSVMAIQENMLASTSGNFNCMVLRAVGWNPPPYFTVEPQSGARYLGTNGTLSASVAGDPTIPSPTITYQWQAGPTNGPFTNLVEGVKYAGTTTATLTVSNLTFNDALPAYVLVARNGSGSVTSSVANIFVIPRTLVGQWFSGATNLTDVSGYSPAGTHDGLTVGGGYSFSSDVPPGWSGQSLQLNAGGISIANSSTADGAYTNTFDADLQTAFTVACWAKGWPGGWNPFMSKYGEGPGWQLRNDGNNNVSPCWTIRGNAGTVTLGLAVFGNAEDMAATSVTFGNDGLWHHYAGTYSALTGVRNLYVDGVLAAQQTNNGVYNLAPSSHLAIGARDSGNGSFGSYFTGNIYDARVYDYDLTASQVAQLAALPDPTVLGQPPTNTSAYVGYDAQISAVVRGTAPITNQWKLNGTNLVDGIYGGALIIGSTSNVLTIYGVTTNNQGVYTLALTNSVGSAVSSNAYLTILFAVPPAATNLVGNWLAGATNLNDVSGYTPAHTHDGGLINGGNTNYNWTSDVPPGAPGGAMSVFLNNSGLVISNTSTADTNVGQAYESTFDTGISSKFSVTFWAKGAPGGGSWNPWISKYGENGLGWQYRIGTDTGRAVWTVRDGSSGTFIDGAMGPSWSRGGDQDDMHGSIVVANTDTWHFYVGTYDVTTGTRKLYVDGVYGGGESGNSQYTTAPSSHLAIGARDSGGGSFGNYFTGTICDVRIYDTALNQANVLSFVKPPPLPAPAFSVKPAVTTGSHGNQFVLTWTYGTLLQATNVAGPWTTNTAAQPYTVIISNAPSMFFKLSYP